jgi:hypothetical protein
MNTAPNHLIDLVLNEIKHRSSRNPIMSSELEYKFETSGATIRKIVSIEGRRNRKLLIVSGHNGYYIARDYREYKEAMQHYIERANSIYLTEKILRDHYEPFGSQQSMF